MIIKRSYFQLLSASAAIGLFLANCTIKESSDTGGDDDDSSSAGCTKGKKKTGCSCPGNAEGFQVCSSDGVYGSCQCPDAPDGTSGSGNGTSGNTGTAGAGNGTAGTGGAGNGTAGTSNTSDAGAGGDGNATTPTFDPENCEECLADYCKKELDACLADTRCISEDGTSGQYVDISDCITQERVKGVAKRDAVRNCGVTLGSSATDATFDDPWAPKLMADATRDLLNCMATSHSETPNAAWANDEDNYLDKNGDYAPAPWPEDSCAKLSCTSKFQ